MPRKLKRTLDYCFEERPDRRERGSVLCVSDGRRADRPEVMLIATDGDNTCTPTASLCLDSEVNCEGLSHAVDMNEIRTNGNPLYFGSHSGVVHKLHSIYWYLRPESVVDYSDESCDYCCDDYSEIPSHRTNKSAVVAVTRGGPESLHLTDMCFDFECFE